MRRLENGAEALEPPLTCSEFRMFVERWGIHPVLAEKLIMLGMYWNTQGYGTLWILSGHRTPEQNRRVGGAPQSDHLLHPSPAADVGFDADPTPQQLADLRSMSRCFGLDTGAFWVPPDPNHVFLRDYQRPSHRVA